MEGELKISVAMATYNGSLYLSGQLRCYDAQQRQRGQEREVGLALFLGGEHG